MAVLAVSLGLLLAGVASSLPDTYKGPVIGILSQKTNGKMSRLGHSYIAASYVKYIEGAGAQVYPVLDSWSKEKLNETLHSLNGMLLPGGAQLFPNSKFYEASAYIYNWVVDRNKNGVHFPLWGTCLGFEAILTVQANLTKDIRFGCSAHMPNNLTIEDGAQDSRLLSNIDSKLYEAIQSEKIVYNAHSFCIDPDIITKEEEPLHSSFNLLATNWDAHGRKYIALVEHKKHPIYASQFHPEKNGFEWSVYVEVPHTHNAIFFMQYLANFLVGEAAQNENEFGDAKEWYSTNINNFSPVYTLSKINSTLESCYFFNDKRNDLDIDTSDDRLSVF